MTAHLIAMALTSLAGGGLVLAACGEVKPSMSASENEFQKPGRTADISAGRGCGSAIQLADELSGMPPSQWRGERRTRDSAIGEARTVSEDSGRP